MESIESGNSITVYLQEGPSDAGGVDGRRRAAANRKRAECEFVDKDEALKDMLDRMGDDGTLYEGLFDGLTGSDNFLPDSYKISLRDLSLYDETVAQIKAVPGVDHITDYSDIADKLSRLDSLITTVGFWMVLILSVVSLSLLPTRSGLPCIRGGWKSVL